MLCTKRGGRYVRASQPVVTTRRGFGPRRVAATACGRSVRHDGLFRMCRAHCGHARFLLLVMTLGQGTPSIPKARRMAWASSPRRQRACLTQTVRTVRRPRMGSQPLHLHYRNLHRHHRRCHHLQRRHKQRQHVLCWAYATLIGRCPSGRRALCARSIV